MNNKLKRNFNRIILLILILFLLFGKSSCFAVKGVEEVNISVETESQEEDEKKNSNEKKDNESKSRSVSYTKIKSVESTKNQDAVADEEVSDFENNKSEEGEDVSEEDFETGIEERKNKYGVDVFLDSSQKYIEESDLDISDLFEKSLKGKFDNNKVLKFITSMAGENIKKAITSISGIVIIVVICTILKTISENLGNESVGQVAFYSEYIMIVIILMKNFAEIVSEMRNTIQNMTAFSNSLIPVFTTLIIATGKVSSANAIEPILLLIISFINNAISNFVLPILLASTALGVVSKISDEVKVDKISKFMKKGSVWGISTALTLFVTIASLEGGLTSSLDSVAKKTGKSVISVAVPVVGNIIGNAIDTISGYANLLKNAVGTIGIVVIALICARPIINLACYTVVYYLGGALIETVADEKISDAVEEIAGTLKIFLAILASITVSIIIGLAIVMKVTS